MKDAKPVTEKVYDTETVIKNTEPAAEEVKPAQVKTATVAEEVKTAEIKPAEPIAEIITSKSVEEINKILSKEYFGGKEINITDYWSNPIKGAMEKEYARIRKSKTYSQVGDKDIATVTGQHNGDVFASGFDGWHRRYTGGNGPITQRVSLQVNPSKELIFKLDEFCKKTGKVEHYKTPKTYEKWFDREDPVTIYLSDSLTNTEMKELIGIVNPYVRPEAVPSEVGTTLSKGVSLARETSTSGQSSLELANILNKRANSINSNLGETIKEVLYNYDNNENITDVKLSSGQFVALEKVINKLANKDVPSLLTQGLPKYNIEQPTPKAETDMPATPGEINLCLKLRKNLLSGLKK